MRQKKALQQAVTATLTSDNNSESKDIVRLVADVSRRSKRLVRARMPRSSRRPRRLRDRHGHRTVRDLGDSRGRLDPPRPRRRRARPRQPVCRPGGDHDDRIDNDDDDHHGAQRQSGRTCDRRRRSPQDHGVDQHHESNDDDVPTSGPTTTTTTSTVPSSGTSGSDSQSTAPPQSANPAGLSVLQGCVTALWFLRRAADARLLRPGRPGRRPGRSEERAPAVTKARSHTWVMCALTSRSR